jgi:hypothetical protein
MAGTAHAASTRAEYVAQVDPICQAGHSQAKAATRSDFRGAAGGGDEGAVSGWLQLRDAASDFLERVARVLARDNARRAGKLLSRAYDREFKAELVVQDFGFRYCTPFLVPG